MVLTDAFTKYVELIAIKNKEAGTVADAIFETWITRYSTPHTIVTDGGKEFRNSLMAKLCEHLKILHKTTTPYYPASNSTVEVFNRTMKRYLQSFISPPFLDWEDYLPCLRICYNTSVSKATHTTPFSLVFGMDANMPFFDLEQYIDYDERENAATHLRRLHNSRRAAKQHNIEYKNTYEKYFNAQYKTAVQKLNAGEFAYLQVVPQQKYKNMKLQPGYSGPYEIIKVLQDNVILKVGKKEHRVHRNRVKLANMSRSDTKQTVRTRQQSKQANQNDNFLTVSPEDVGTPGPDPNDMFAHWVLPQDQEDRDPDVMPDLAAHSEDEEDIEDYDPFNDTVMDPPPPGHEAWAAPSPAPRPSPRPRTIFPHTDTLPLPTRPVPSEARPSPPSSRPSPPSASGGAIPKSPARKTSVFRAVKGLMTREGNEPRTSVAEEAFPTARATRSTFHIPGAAPAPPHVPLESRRGRPAPKATPPPAKNRGRGATPPKK